MRHGPRCGNAATAARPARRSRPGRTGRRAWPHARSSTPGHSSNRTTRPGLPPSAHGYADHFRPIPGRDTDAMPNPAGLPTPPHPARLRVGIIGAGRVGTALGAALARAGHRLTGVSAVSEASRQRAARALPGVPVARPQEVLAGADLALLTVPDDVLPGLVAGLSAAGAPLEGRLLAHTSGRHR